MTLNEIVLDEEVLRLLMIRIIGMEKENLLSDTNHKKTDAEMVKLLKKNIEEKVKWKLRQ